MSTILVGVEASERSDDAIAFAWELGRASESRVLLAGAVPYPAIAVFGDGAAAVAAEEMIAQTEALLTEKATSLRDAGVETDIALRAFVSPAHLLQDLAQEERADLIVVGSTDHEHGGRVLPGTTGERLLHGAPCPVVVAPLGYRDAVHPPRHVGVGFDGSDESHAALAAGARVAMQMGGDVEVITVMDVRHFGTPALMGGPGYVRTREEVVRFGHEHLDRAVATMPAGAHATARLLEGGPADRLAEHSSSLDLLIVGSRRYGPMRAVLLGGVSGRVIRHAACPVLVTPRGVEQPLARLFPFETAIGNTS